MSNINQTQLRLRDALLALMLTMDADKITAVDLARKAGVSRATFYRYYDSVDTVLCEREDEFLEGMRDCHRYYISTPIDMKDLSKPHPVFIAIAEFLCNHKQFFLSMTGPHGDARFIYRWHKFFQEFNYGKLTYEGLTRKDLDIYMEFALAGNDAVIRYWLEKRPDIKPEEGAPIMQRILYGPLIC